MVTVSIEMKPYLVKYLLIQSENLEQPMIFPRKHPYNIMLINLVTNYYHQRSFPLEDRENAINYLLPPNNHEKAVI